MDLSMSRVQHIQKPPSVYFIPFSSPPSRRPPTRGFFTLFVDFPPPTSNRIDEYMQRPMDRDYRRVACNSMY